MFGTVLLFGGAGFIVGAEGGSPSSSSSSSSSSRVSASDSVDASSSSAWLLAIIGATLCWGVADVLCDICIGEDEEDEDESETESLISAQKRHVNDEDDARGDIEMVLAPASSSLLRRAPRQRNEIKTTMSPETETSHDVDIDDDDSNDHLTGEQDCAVAGLVTFAVVYLMSIKRTMDKGAADGSFTPHDELMGPDTVAWSPWKDVEWWVAAFGGFLLFWHYLLLLWAYDTAPSTLITPLLQVSSTWVLLGSAIPAAITGATFIRPFDLICYAIIVAGGLLPSVHEKGMSFMFSKAFWKKSFVRCTVLSEVCVGLYDLLLSACVGSSARRTHMGASVQLSSIIYARYSKSIGSLDVSSTFDNVDGFLENLQEKDGQAESVSTALEDEFFYIAWCWFVIVFAFTYLCHPRLRRGVINLRHLSIKVLVLSSFGQVLTILGYYLSQFGYSWYYQASVVHACESSLNQVFNLVLAVVLYRFFGLGRSSAASGVPAKLASCTIVSAGLFMLSTSGAH